MRRRLLIVAIAFLFPAAARPDDASDLRDRALKAAAKDPADLKKLKIHTLKAKGINHAGPDPSPATYELAAAWPTQVRHRWELGVGPAKTTVTLVGIDDRGWRKIGDMKATDLGVEDLNDFRADTYAIWVSTLSTLNDADSKLSSAPPSKVNGELVLGLRVSRRSWPEITLYFDAKTSLLRKMAYRAREAGVTANKEFIYDAHKEIKGVMLPTKQTLLIANREVFSWTDVEYDFPEKLESKLFEKP
jgi:hypothetical protein